MKQERYIDNLTIEKMVHGGQGLAHHNGKTVFVWNALPGEVVRARELKRRKGIIEAVAVEVVNASPHRIEPIDDHYLSSAPWQMMTMEAEVNFKKQIAHDTFEHIARVRLPDLELVGDERHLGYRNKMEFGFFEDSRKELRLSLFNRGSRFPQPLTSCSIALPQLWHAAQDVLGVLVKQRISRWDLKYLVVRTNQAGESLIGLYVRNESFDEQAAQLLPALQALHGIIGVHIMYSTPKSPAAVTTRYLVGGGVDSLREELLGTRLEYGLQSFFQVNPPVFEQALTMMQSHVPQGADILDFYAGVGSIGIPLRDRVRSALLVDENSEAISYAQSNSTLNGCAATYRAVATPAEKIVDEITADKLLIVDPPRAGLHTNVIQRMLEVQPQTVIYLSCNIATQARDLAALKSAYRVVDAKLFNFFPRTPHCESLLILKKKQPFLARLLDRLQHADR